MHSFSLKTRDGINLDDIFCLKEEREVGKDNSFSLDGVTYTIPREHNMVAFKARLHIYPGKKIRVWHREEFLCELPHLSPERRAGQKVMFFDPHPRISFLLVGKRYHSCLRTTVLTG